MVILWWFNSDLMGYNPLVMTKSLLLKPWPFWKFVDDYPARKWWIFPVCYVNVYQLVHQMTSPSLEKATSLISWKKLKGTCKKAADISFYPSVLLPSLHLKFFNIPKWGCPEILSHILKNKGWWTMPIAVENQAFIPRLTDWDVYSWVFLCLHILIGLLLVDWK